MAPMTDLVATSTVEGFCEYTPDQYINLLSTYSLFIALEAELRRNLFDAICAYILDSGSTIRLSYLPA